MEYIGAMSALGQKQTFAAQNGMSALPLKADMCGATSDVCFGPIADIAMAIFEEPCEYRPKDRPFVWRPEFY